MTTSGNVYANAPVATLPVTGTEGKFRNPCSIF